MVQVDASEQPSIETLLILGSPAVVDCDSYDEFPKLSKLSTTY